VARGALLLPTAGVLVTLAAGLRWWSGRGLQTPSEEVLSGATLRFWRDTHDRCLTFTGKAKHIHLQACEWGQAEQDFVDDEGLLRWKADLSQCISGGEAKGKRFPLVSLNCDRRNLGQLWGEKGSDNMVELGNRHICIFYSSKEGDDAWGGPCIEGQPGRPLPVSQLREGWSLRPPEESQAESVDPRYEDEADTKLFCFMAVLPESSEVPLQAMAKKHKASIYACDLYKVYDSYPSPIVHQGSWNSFANLDSFSKVWSCVFDDELWKQADWTVKVDPDAVWVPNRLKAHIAALHPKAEEALYIKNTDISFGFLGAIEVLSTAAVKVFKRRYKICQEQHGGQQTGEDGWIKECLDDNEVAFLEDVNMLKSSDDVGACSDEGFVAFHPHKQEWDWGDCLNRAR